MSTSTDKAPRKSRADDATKKKWVDEINERLGRQTKGIFETGDVLVEAKQALVDKDFREVVKATGLRSFKNADNYMRVARHESLRKPGIFEHLPATVGALIDMAVWNEEMLLKAVNEKALHPLATRSDLKAWEGQYIMRPFTKPKDATETDVVVGYIIADTGYVARDCRDLKPRLDGFIKQINEAGFDLAFVASKNEKVTHYGTLRRLLEDKIKRQYGPDDEPLYQQQGMTRIFGSFMQFKNDHWDWAQWAPKFDAAVSMGRVSHLDLKPDEVEFIRCQVQPRRPYPNSRSETRARQNRHSVERFMVKPPKPQATMGNRGVGESAPAGST